jgi:hypothetical protein
VAAAEIEDTDADGKVLDFHGQRMTFISGLARAGVSPTKAQKLARHSDVNLTLRTYTHLKAEELASAVESLPSLPGTKEAETTDDNEAEMQRVVEAWPKRSQAARQEFFKIIIEATSQNKGWV